MKTKVVCILAAAILAMSVSSTAAATATATAKDEGAKATHDTEEPRTAAATKDPSNGHSGLAAQQNRMKHCNEEAKKKELKGDERRAFMSACLKG
jgi:hypothetical protein